MCRCEGQKTCAITASNANFGDSCANTGKYLEVIYQCEGTYDYEVNYCIFEAFGVVVVGYLILSAAFRIHQTKVHYRNITIMSNI